MPAPSPRYWLLENGRSTGPHSLAVLKQKADVHAITPDTPHASENDPTQWSPLRESEVLFAELFPERPHFALAPKIIQHVNTSAEPHHAPSVEEMLRANLARQRAAEGELLPPIPPRSNRRKNDYLLLTIAGNLLAVLAYVFLPTNAVVFVSLVSYVAIFNVGVAWIMFGVMDRY